MIVITAIAGVIGYAVNSGVVWIPALALSVGSFAGSYIGARLLKVVPTLWLTWGFAALLAILAGRLLFDSSEQGTGSISLSWTALLGMVALGLCAGVLSGLLGIGGGILVVPLLVLLFGFTNVEAKGTSLAMMIPAGISGTFVNVRNGLADVKAGLAIGVVAAMISYAGVAVSVIMPTVLGNVLFAALMLFTAVQFILRAVRATKHIDH